MNIALKEWASVVAALDQGRQVCLLRKGGLVEIDRGGFDLRYGKFLLFPTYEHEHTLLLQDRFKPLVVEPQASNHRLSLVCEVTDVIVTAGFDALQAAADQFIWNDAFLRKRLEYKPNLPLYAIVLRAFRLPFPIHIPDRPSYAGCKSWVHIKEEVDVEDAVPVLTDSEFTALRETLLDSLQRNLAFR